MYSRLRILYLILLIIIILTFVVFFFQNLNLTSMSFFQWKNFIPLGLGLAFAFLLGLLTAIFANLFISANRESMFGEGNDSRFRDEDL
ncbi:MAG: hypothetical protein ACK4NC_02540 [Candidatus Gracilibacteria bacterium]